MQKNKQIIQLLQMLHKRESEKIVVKIQETLQKKKKKKYKANFEGEAGIFIIENFTQYN